MALMENLNFMIVDGHFFTDYHSGPVIINDIGSYEFVGMKKEIFY
jgi:hypothetical protein